jgi:hypothetical protein
VQNSAKNMETGFGCGVSVRFCLRTELKEQLDQKLSISHDPFRLVLDFKAATFQFSFALLDIVCPERAVIT